MATRSYTAIIEKEGTGYVSLCPELDVASDERCGRAGVDLNERFEPGPRGPNVVVEQRADGERGRPDGTVSRVPEAGIRLRHAPNIGGHSAAPGRDDGLGVVGAGIGHNNDLNGESGRE